jgi:hypothetical protein
MADFRFRKEKRITKVSNPVANGFNHWRQYIGNNKYQKIRPTFRFPRLKQWAIAEMEISNCRFQY